MNPPASRRFVRVLCRLYPPSWRARYGEEYAVLLSEMSLTPRAIVDVLAGALDAWVSPSPVVLSGHARLRASVSVVWSAWIVLAAGALLFAQSTEDAVFRHADAAHPVNSVTYGVYEWCAHLSVAAVCLAGAPLVWAFMRAARTRQRRGPVVLMLLPFIAPPCFLVALVIITRAVPHSSVPGVGVGAAWFAVLAVLGLLAAALCAAGPVLAMRQVCPSPAVMRWVLRASIPALGLMGASAVASVVYEVALAQSDPSFAAGFGRPWWQLAPYAFVMAAACMAAITSTRRGIRPTLVSP